MPNLEIKRFTPAVADEWNSFVVASKNGTFLFDRRYMDYHADRFQDHSLMIYRRGRLYALLPANVAGDTLFSHQGLTYGGLIMSDHTTAAEVVEIFRQLNAQLRAEELLVVEQVEIGRAERCLAEEMAVVVQLAERQLESRRRKTSSPSGRS